MNTTSLEDRIHIQAQQRAENECFETRQKLEAFFRAYGISDGEEVTISGCERTPSLFVTLNGVFGLIAAKATDFHTNRLLERLLEHALNEKGNQADKVPF
jgi:hypothetical protein